MHLNKGVCSELELKVWWVVLCVCHIKAVLGRSKALVVLVDATKTLDHLTDCPKQNLLPLATLSNWHPQHMNTHTRTEAMCRGKGEHMWTPTDAQMHVHTHVDTYTCKYAHTCTDTQSMIQTLHQRLPHFQSITLVHKHTFSLSRLWRSRCPQMSLSLTDSSNNTFSASSLIKSRELKNKYTEPTAKSKRSFEIDMQKASFPYK